MIDIEEVTRYSQNLNVLYVEDDVDAREITNNALGRFFLIPSLSPKMAKRDMKNFKTTV